MSKSSSKELVQALLARLNDTFMDFVTDFDTGKKVKPFKFSLAGR